MLGVGLVRAGRRFMFKGQGVDMDGLGDAQGTSGQGCDPAFGGDAPHFPSWEI